MLDAAPERTRRPLVKHKRINITKRVLDALEFARQGHGAVG